MCERKECGYGEGTGPCPTLLTDTRRRVVSLSENTVRMSGVEFREPRNLCVRVRKECGYGEGPGAHSTLEGIGPPSIFKFRWRVLVRMYFCVYES